MRITRPEGFNIEHPERILQQDEILVLGADGKPRPPTEEEKKLLGLGIIASETEEQESEQFNNH